VTQCAQASRRSLTVPHRTCSAAGTAGFFDPAAVRVGCWREGTAVKLDGGIGLKPIRFIYCTSTSNRKKQKGRLIKELRDIICVPGISRDRIRAVDGDSGTIQALRSRSLSTQRVVRWPSCRPSYAINFPIDGSNYVNFI
jgi:hypothetical protein